MSGAAAVALVAIGTIAFLDRWPVAQAMVARPIVVGTAAGVALGDPAAGALWGAVFEAMYLGLLPVGAARLPDAGLAALAGTTAAITGMSDGAYPAALAGTLGWLAGHLGDVADRLQRRWNGALAAWGHRGAEAGDPRAPGRALLGAMVAATALGAAVSGAAVAAAVGVTAWFGPGPGPGALEAPILRLLVGAGLAVTGARAFLAKDRTRVAWAGGALGAALLVWGVG